MNNEEKAQELSEKAIDYIPCNSTLPFYLNALKMAEWKDQEFLKLIDSKLDYARSKIEERHDKMDRIKYEGMRKILLEIKKDIEK